MKETALIAEIDRQCNRCRMKIRQSVFFRQQNGRITIRIWQRRCPFCKAFIKKPTVEEVRRSIMLKE